MPIDEVLQKGDEELKAFLNSDTGKLHKIENDDKNEIDLGFAINNVSKYHYNVNLFSQLINMSKQVDTILKSRNIMSLIEVQKELISKINHKGKKIPDK